MPQFYDEFCASCVKAEPYILRFSEDGVTGEIAEGPTYHPSIEQFQDPVRYIDSVSPHAIPYGLCRIIPPEDWEV